MAWTDEDIKRATERSSRYFADALKSKEAAAADKKKTLRHAYSECKMCFYFRKTLAGQAFRKYKCGGCGEEKYHPNTATPLLCHDCASTKKLCVRCGGTVD